MKRCLFFCLTMFLCQFAYAQLQDDFSDGNFNTNPKWSGDTSEFIVNANFELQLNAPDAGTSVLYAPVLLQDSTEWQFYFKLDFAPSNTNLLRIYLQADDAQLLNAKAYYLEVGETGNLDALRFYRQDGLGISELLGSFTLGSLANQPAVARLKVVRSAAGKWSFDVDYSGGKNFTPELSVTDNNFIGGNSYFGFYCLYTATRKDKYFFDDVHIFQPVPDQAAPVVTKVDIASAFSLDVYFDETVEKLSAEVLTNFNINQGIGNPDAAFLDGINNKLVHLNFAKSFESFKNYTLGVSGISDLFGNISGTQEINFTYAKGDAPNVGEILINEIMPDPTPVVGLPELEFVELFNNSAKFLSTKGLVFSDGTTNAILPDQVLMPNTYYILCAKKDSSAFKIFGSTLLLDAFPSLNNTGDMLSLKSESGTLIDAVNYSDTWYQDNVKKLGGWTLELINPLNKCLDAANWIASSSAIGGTPGKQNSVYKPALDVEPPFITQVVAYSQDSVLLVFNKKIDANPSQFIGLFTVNPGVGVNKVFVQVDGKSVILKLDKMLIAGQYYTILIKPGFKDCSGNANTQDLSFQFALAAVPGLHDLVVNEILYNPKTGGSDFLEIYNRSDKIFDLADLTIINYSATVTRVKMSTHQLILPNTYLAITSDVENIKANYTVPDSAILVQSSLPSFSDDQGTPGIIYGNQGMEIWIDSFTYNKTFQYALLDVLDGVSLERINFNSFQLGSANWQSASSKAGFATPGYKNSQYYNGIPTVKKGKFALSSKRVSPDNDGFEDFILIDYSFDKPGFTQSVNIYDAQGRKIRELGNNDLAGLDGTYEWDGLRDDQTKPPLGIYIIFIQYFDLEGNVFEEKIPVVVAGRL